jgi:magnesium-transporting ATPase (P-type)
MHGIRCQLCLTYNNLIISESRLSSGERDFFIPMKNIKYITGSFVIVMAAILAAYLYFTPIFSDRVYGGRRTILICLLLGYAIFRGARMYLNFQKEKQDEKTRNL